MLSGDIGCRAVPDCKSGPARWVYRHSLVASARWAPRTGRLLKGTVVARVNPGLSVGVIPATEVRVREHIVRLLNPLENSKVSSLVRMMLHDQRSVGLLDVRSGIAVTDTQHFVERHLRMQ